MHIVIDIKRKINKIKGTDISKSTAYIHLSAITCKGS